MWHNAQFCVPTSMNAPKFLTLMTVPVQAVPSGNSAMSSTSAGRPASKLRVVNCALPSCNPSPRTQTSSLAPTFSFPCNDLSCICALGSMPAISEPMSTKAPHLATYSTTPDAPSPMLKSVNGVLSLRRESWRRCRKTPFERLFLGSSCTRTTRAFTCCPTFIVFSGSASAVLGTNPGTSAWMSTITPSPKSSLTVPGYSSPEARSAKAVVACRMVLNPLERAAPCPVLCGDNAGVL
mmetsp:Transcript_41877/g.76092  ORF Transcript_41877/g.76092 Transcript_41877/m.76092 type:complete len:237 (+) Transcript_41877:413-1123(+)